MIQNSPPVQGPQAVDILIRGGDIVTVDTAGTVIADGAIAIEGGRIAWIGANAAVDGAFTATTTLDNSGRIAMPGMIDAHVHTAQQLLRSKIAQIGRLRPPKNPIWKNYFIPFESILTPDDVYLSGLVAYTNMLRVGTTCFAESGGPHPDEMGRAALKTGIRGLIALSTIDQGQNLPASMLMTTDQALRANVDLVARWAKQDRVTASLALRQIIVCTPELVKAMAAAARDLDVKIHTHLCEGIYEIDFALEKFGMRPAEYLANIGALDYHLHCAHSVILSAEEVDLYVQHRPSTCHCAFNNYRIGTPRLREMWRRGIDVGLGTDGAAAWGTLDIFQVAHFARLGQQMTAGTPWHQIDPLPAEEILRIATVGGARALGLAADIGQLTVGRRADIILVDASESDQAPMMDPLFTAANTVIGRDVRTVLVDGRLVMKEREILTVDMDALRDRLSRRLPDLMERFERLVA